MNFLAHLHIADKCHSSFLGNLLGDFVKGDPDKLYPLYIARGIRLHRFVDSFTDAHPVMRDVKSLFPAKQRRFAGIALDVMWDHFLATKWSQYHNQALRDFCQYAERDIATEQALEVVSVPQRYELMTTRMWQGRWLESYRELDNIEFALSRMSQRSERMQPLADCFTPMATNYQQLAVMFDDFYPNLLNVSRDFYVNSGN